MSFNAGNSLLINDLVTSTAAGNTTAFTTTAVTYQYTGVQIASFVIPHTGAVRVTVVGRVWSTSASYHAYLTFALFTPSGIFWNPADFESFRVFGTAAVRGSATTIVTGLPPNAIASCPLYLRSENTSATANAQFTRVIVRGA